jgi:hypothetical protein
MERLREYIIEEGLLWFIRAFGARRGAAAFCEHRAKEARNLLCGRAGRDIFGFPATRKCSRLLGVLGANGYAFKGMLDNDRKKQGLMLEGYVILTRRLYLCVIAMTANCLSSYPHPQEGLVQYWRISCAPMDSKKKDISYPLDSRWIDRLLVIIPVVHSQTRVP